MEIRENVRLKLSEACDWLIRLAVAREAGPKGAVFMDAPSSASIRRMNRLGILRRVRYPKVRVQGRLVRRTAYAITRAGISYGYVLKANIQEAMPEGSIFTSTSF